MSNFCGMVRMGKGLLVAGTSLIMPRRRRGRHFRERFAFDHFSINIRKNGILWGDLVNPLAKIPWA